MDRKMSIIEILEDKIIKEYQEKSYQYLMIEKTLIETNFNWLKLDIQSTYIKGEGKLRTPLNTYQVELLYSPFLKGRFDRIYIKNIDLQYHPKIHVYPDLTLCLYHPIFDKPIFKNVALARMIPWITEWCIHYEEWKKYGVWLGKEILH